MEDEGIIEMKHNLVVRVDEIKIKFSCKKCNIKSFLTLPEIRGYFIFSFSINTPFHIYLNLRKSWCDISDNDWKMRELLK